MIVLGIGTGRCGTTSLSFLLKEFGYNSTHEFRFKKKRCKYDWGSDDFDEIINKLCKRGEYTADVSFTHLPYISLILDKYNFVKVICIERDKQGVIESFKRYNFYRNYWIKDKTDIFNDGIFPKFCVNDNIDGINEYYNMYYRVVRNLKNFYKDKILIGNMNFLLNTVEGQYKICDFINVDRKFIPNIHLNKIRS